jgi:hypothetical protein
MGCNSRYNNKKNLEGFMRDRTFDE